MLDLLLLARRVSPICQLDPLSDAVGWLDVCVFFQRVNLDFGTRSHAA